MPRSRAIRTTPATGRIWPVMLIMWHIRMSRVRGVTCSAKSRTTSAGSSAGMGIGNCRSTIPSRRSRCLKVVIIRG